MAGQKDPSGGVALGVRLAVTGSLFTAAGFRTVDSVLRELILSANREVLVAAYFLSPAALEFLRLLEGALARGVAVTVVVSSMRSQPKGVRKYLEELRGRYPHARILEFRDPLGGRLHAKAVVVDRNRALVGSANFTWGGLVANYEICVLLEGPQAAEVARLLDAIISACSGSDGPRSPDSCGRL